MNYNNIKSKVERIVYYNQQSKWGILSVKNTLKGDSIFTEPYLTLSGNFEGVYTDCEVQFSGDLKVHPRYGSQIELSSIKIVTDKNSKESIINFLSKSTIKGICTLNALKIYNKYRDKSIETVLNNPEVLSEIRGIGTKTVSKIKDSIITYKKMEELINYCTDLGIPYSTIYKLDKELGEDALKIIKKNIYSALDKTDNLSFKQIDEIALKSGIAVDDKNRAEYCFMYTLKSKVSFGGSTGCTSPELRDCFLKEMGISDNSMYSAMLNVLIGKNKVILENNKIYYKEFYDTENYIAEIILGIATREKKKGIISKKALEEEMKDFPFELNEGQIIAIKRCLLNDISILTGGGGTGKSTITKVLSNTYSRSGFNVVLLSPTGKATRRIEECTGRKAFTVHKFLGVKHTLADAELPDVPENTVILIDESSMLDIMLFAKLLECIKGDTKIVLIGDINQLPSVQAGNVLGDLIASGKINVCMLTDIMRQKENSNIIKYSSYVNSGECIDECNVHDFVYKEFDDEDDIVRELVNNYSEEIKEHGLNNVQVITVYKKGTLGTNNLNKYLSDIVNRNEADETFGFKLADKVMQLTNNYEKDVFNGEVGTVTLIEDDTMYVDFGKCEIEYPIEEINDVTLAYVNTVHKSQGSEYPIVFVILDDISSFLLIRKVLYTAISRGKNKVYMYSKPSCVMRCINNDYYTERITKLKQFLQR